MLREALGGLVSGRNGEKHPGTYVLDMVEAEWGASACVLQGLCGEGLIVAVDEAAKQKRCFGMGWGTWDKTLPGGITSHEGAGAFRALGLGRYGTNMACTLLSAQAGEPWAQSPCAAWGHKGSRGSLELAEDVSIFGRDAGRLQDCHTEGEGTAQAEVVQGSVQGPVQGGFLRAV